VLGFARAKKSKIGAFLVVLTPLTPLTPYLYIRDGANRGKNKKNIVNIKKRIFVVLEVLGVRIAIFQRETAKSERKNLTPS
jgi:hypothetical protein